MALRCYIPLRTMLATTAKRKTPRYEVSAPPVATTFKLISPRGASLATRVWPCEKKPRAILLIVHGSGWHSGYYEDLAERMNGEGIFCASYDQVNCGYSEPEPGAPEGCMHIRAFDDLVEDVFSAIVWAKEEAGYHNLPFFLFGESFGGLQVLEAAFQAEHYRVKLSGVICSGASLEIAPGLLPPRFIVQLLSFFAPYYPRLRMPATDLESTFDSAFGDKEWAATVRRDPKICVSVNPTLSGAAATVTTGELVAQQAKHFPVPLLAIHSVDDCRTLCSAMRKFVDQVGPKKAEGFWVEGTTGHQLLQDRPEITQCVLDKIAGWTIKQLSGLT